MWLEPKTDWSPDDYFNYMDYNRIKNNIEHIKELSMNLYVLENIETLGVDKSSYADIPYADEFTAMEDMLELLQNSTYPFSVEITKAWVENQPTPTYEDFNRLEQMCLDFYNGFTSQKNNKHRISFRLGTFKNIKI